jgi:signal transduction histidine kinase
VSWGHARWNCGGPHWGVSVVIFRGDDNGRRPGSGAAPIGVGLLAPVVVLLAGRSETQAPSGLLMASSLLAYSFVLGAGVLTYFHWRIVHTNRPDGFEDRFAQWLMLGLTTAAANGLLQLSVAPRGNGWLAVAQLLVLFALCLCALLAEDLDVPGSPLVASGVVAVGTPLAYLLGHRIAPPLALENAQVALLATGVLTTGLTLGWMLLGRTCVAPDARRRLAGAAVLLSAAQCLRTIEPTTTLGAGLTGGAAACNLLGAWLLGVTAFRLLRRSVLESQSTLGELQRSLAEVRAATRRERELLHEVGATLAGITTASQTMRLGDALPVQRRVRLETMLTAELARLERLVERRLARAGEPDDREDEIVYLDDVVEPVVLSHQTRGRQIAWWPSRQSAPCDPDDLAELCNILLENAARHAPGAPVSLSVTAEGHGVRVVCSDCGPGVPPELRERIFNADVKGDASSGQGLGLAIARRLAEGRGGRLEVLDDHRPGATFVAELPAREVDRGHTADVA